LKVEIEINEYDVIDRIANQVIRNISIDKLKAEIVNKVCKEIKSDIINSSDVQTRINKAVINTTASVTGRINQKSEEVIQKKLDELMSKKLVIKVGE